MERDELLYLLGDGHVLTRMARRDGAQAKLVRQVVLTAMERRELAATAPPRQEQLFVEEFEEGDF